MENESLKKKIIILGNASIRNGNRGCVALSYCAIYLIDLLYGKAGYELYLTDSQENLGTHEIKIHDKVIPYHSIGHPFPKTKEEVAKKLFSIKETLRICSVFKKADCILDIGQGDSFADIYGTRRFSLIDSIHRDARLFSKRYILLPQTIGPFRQKSTTSKAATSLANAAFVMTRDKASLDFVREITPHQKNVDEYIDVAFFLPYKKIDFEKGCIHVGLNISALLWHGGYTQNNQFGLKTDYQTLVRRIIDRFLHIEGVKLHLISHVVSSFYHIENDYEVSYDLWREYQDDNLILAPLPLSPIDVKDYIAGMDFFLGARMHATIAAFSAGVPVVPMAYSRKFNGLYIETLNYNHIADLTANGTEDTLQMIQESFDHRESLSEEIAATLASTVQKQKDKLLKDLKEHLI